MNERQSKIARTISLPLIVALIFAIYYQLGLMEREDFSWQLWVVIGLTLSAGLLLLWRMELRRRVITLVLWGALHALYFSIVSVTTSLWILTWLPIALGLSVLLVALVVAYFPSQQHATNRR